MSHFGNNPADVLHRLVEAVNDHDLEGLVACFHHDYLNETPAHPARGFRGRDQVRRNWTQIFHSVPDVHARVLRTAVQGGTLWTEWEMYGTRGDGGAFLMRGVIVFGVADMLIASARFYLEPVEDTTGNVNQALTRLMHTGRGSKETS